MRRKELLQVEERDLNVARLEELPELFVHDENASIVRMLQTVFGNVLGEKLGNFTSGNQFSRRKTDKFAKLIGDFLLTVETVVSRARSRLGSVRVVLLSLDLFECLVKHQLYLLALVIFTQVKPISLKKVVD